jgi:hypothetical protein
MFHIGQVITVSEDKTITVVCPEIAGSLQIKAKPMRMSGTWRSVNVGNNVVILGERNNYLYAGRADDKNTYDVLITYIGDGKPDQHVPIWELLKVSLAWLYKALDPTYGHVHGFKNVVVPDPVSGPLPLVDPVGLILPGECDPPSGCTFPRTEQWLSYSTEHGQQQADVEEDELAAEFIRIEGND